MKRTIPVLIVWIGILSVALPASGNEPNIAVRSQKKIWDAAPHNAFTDLIRFSEEWICVFREGAGHVSPDGKLRVIASKEGDTWESAALISDSRGDLRDAKITQTPDGKLMLCGAVALTDKSKGVTHLSLAWFSDDGRNWSEPVTIGEPNNWLWRVTWRGSECYGFGYGVGKDRYVRLYHSADGKKFDTHVPLAFTEGYPNETSIVFEEDGTARVLLRRDGDKKSGQLGTAKPPYKDWTWKDLGTRIGGPHMVQLPDGRYFAVVRLYDGGARTSLCSVDIETGSIQELHKLPSGGDTSYAGIVYHENELWISYYSSHEGKTSIYLARVQIGKL